MNPRAVILNRLLDKYENSKHLYEPGASRRRVLLQAGKKTFPEYDYEQPEVRDAFNQAARELEAQGLISLQWVKGREVIERFFLQLEENALLAAYRMTGRLHPRERALQVIEIVQSALADCQTPWMARWRDEVCAAAQNRFQVPGFCREDFQGLHDLLRALRCCDGMGEDGITMRALSVRCFQDSKHFEHHVRDEFLRVAEGYHDELRELSSQEGVGIREKLAVLGIYARPELYELAGDCAIRTKRGSIDLGAAEPNGLALPSSSVSLIQSWDLRPITTVTFIENKTNYDEYLLTEKAPDELVFYHGGFLSPQKMRLIGTLADSAPAEMAFRFWGDIDLGGFQMFERLRSILPALMPMRMGAEEVERFHIHGLGRSEEYCQRLRDALTAGAFPVFEASIRSILKHRVTIEQEVFLL